MTGQAGAILDIWAERDTVDPRVMIVVAHPDDETIGMGAQLRKFRDALLLQVTDGAPRDGYDAVTHGFANIAGYAFARRVELRAALEVGRAGEVRAEIVGIPDQEACLNVVPLTEHILRLLREDAPVAIFIQPYEGFREAPNYDFLRPPHQGELHYERLGCGITGEIWRRHARTALDALGLLSPPWV